MVFSSDVDVEIPISDLVSHAFANSEVNLDTPVYIDAYNPANSLTASQVRQSVRRLIGGLREHGLQQGDAVCVHTFNHVWYSTIYLGIIGAGGIFVGSNPAYTEREMRRLLTVSKTKFIIVQPELYENVIGVAQECGVSTAKIFMLDLVTKNPAETKSLGHMGVSTFLQAEEQDWVSLQSEPAVKATPAAILWTSGTGGLPKAAVISHYSLVSQSVIAEWTGRQVPYQVRRLISLPLFHSFCLPYHIAALREGHRTYIMDRFRRNDFVEHIARHQITSIPVVPPIALTVLGDDGTERGKLASLREIICAGAPLGKDVQMKLSQSLHSDARLVQLWGMSEVGWLAAFAHPDAGEWGSVGRLLPNTRAMILDEEGVEVTYSGQRGELYVRNSGMMTKYLSDAEATAKSFRDGWFSTGDIGYCKDGQWFVVDRAKDLIKVRGWQVSPAELEACLLEHPAITDAAVIGIDSEDGHQELPKAYVVLKRGTDHQPDEQNIKDFIKQNLASYKALDGGVQFVDAIPRTVSGKILRRVLKEMARNGSPGGKSVPETVADAVQSKIGVKETVVEITDVAE